MLSASLPVFPQPGPLQGIPRKSSNFIPTPKTLKNQKKWVPGTPKATKKASKSRLNILQFTKHEKKWNLTKTTVFIMFLTHSTPHPGIISSSKPTKKHPSELTLKISHLKLRKNTQRFQKRPQSGSQISSKIDENPTLDPKVSPLVLLSTPGSPTGDPRCKNQAPKVPK